MVPAQYGSGPSNDCPENYSGSIFTGVVTETQDNQITMTFSKGNKTDAFTGQFEVGCSVPATDGRAMMPVDIPKGTVMTAFFNANTKKVDGKKTKENQVIGIAFETWQGQKVAEDKKKIYWCTKVRQMHFKAYQ